MLTINPLPVEDPESVEPAAPPEVMLANGVLQSLEGMTTDQLHQLQWEQEQKFAEKIRICPPRSPERHLVTSTAYDTICTILAVQRGDAAGELSMGLDPRYVRLVLRLLDDQLASGAGDPTLFEIGYGSGHL